MKEIDLAVAGGDLRIDIETPEGICAICRMPPPAQQLILGIVGPPGTEHRVSICRDCLSEFAPNLLSVLEEDL